MWRIYGSLSALLVVTVLVEVTVIPALWSNLRVDLFLGLVVGLAVYGPFSHGFVFTALSTLLLQAFTGARFGYLPFVYMMIYFLLDVMKGLIFLENIVVQCLLGFILNLVIVEAATLFVRMDVLQEGWLPLLAGAGCTALATPLMAYTVRLIWSGYEE
ncbi:MAG TPA: hypothetical protein PLB81_07055 [Deltaproteobacteria bacterium]|nr:hypothetical protein [Deltaproteobacteria bacterium]